MSYVEIIVKIAKIEGVDLLREEYNPFLWSILGPLMLKYKACVYQTTGQVFIYSDGQRISTALFKNDDEIPAAILECIIKSQEK